MEIAWSGGREKAALILEVRAFCKPVKTDEERDAKYENTRAAWKFKMDRWEAAGGEYTGVPPPEEPEKPEPEAVPTRDVPGWLSWYFELKRWNTFQFVAGGLMDQPAWAWDMVDLAGKVYETERTRHASS